jgi:hypothetical protein
MYHQEMTSLAAVHKGDIQANQHVLSHGNYETCNFALPTAAQAAS